MKSEPTEKERFTIILEDINSKFDYLVEWQVNFREEINRKFDEFKHENKEDHDDLKRAIKQKSLNLSDHEQRIYRLENKVFN